MFLEKYLSQVSKENRDKRAIAYLASLDCIEEEHPLVAHKIIEELKAQRSHLKLIASENFSSIPVQLAMGNLLTDKYSEGIPYRRFYAGCENVDAIEAAAVEELKSIFGCDHAYVQPHSGADANMVAMWAILLHRVQSKELEALSKPLNALNHEEYNKLRQLLVNQKMMGLSLNSGGHLTHGYRHNNSAKIFEAVTYDVDRKSETIDYQALAEQVKKEKPLILLAGYSAYPRLIDFAKMREIADLVGAVLMVDMAHFSGLVAGKVLQEEFNPVPFADLITSTTHKTMRGPRGGMVLCKEEYREAVDKGCPMVLGGPLPHVIAAKAMAFKEANGQSFSTYAHQVVANAKAMAEELTSLGVRLVTGGTDNHLLILDIAGSFPLTGKDAEEALRQARFTVNRNTIPFDEKGAWITSGIRIGTPAMTTLGMKEGEMKKIATMIVTILKSTKSSEKGVVIDADVLEKVRGEVSELLEDFPLYPEIIID